MGYTCKGFHCNDYCSAKKEAVKFVSLMLSLHDKIQEITYEKRWQPCFDHCYISDENPKQNAFCILLNLVNCYPNEYVDSDAFTKRVNNWIRVGKALGLYFNNLKWEVLKDDRLDKYRKYYLTGVAREEDQEAQESRVLMFYLPMENINTTKMLHLHLFFLRYLYEKYATIDRYYGLRKWLKKEYPWVSRFGTLILAEQTCHYAEDKVGLGVWYKGIHRFLQCKDLSCLVLTANKIGTSNMVKMMDGVELFDTQLGGPGVNSSSYLHECLYDKKIVTVMSELDKQYKEKVKFYE